MSGASIWELNLQALTSGSAGSGPAAGLSRAAPCPELAFLPSARGPLVPARLLAGRPLPLHSTVDPIKEGIRLASRTPEAGYLVVLGMGGGYHITPLLARPSLSRLVVIERDLSLVRSVLERIDLSALLADRRLRFHIGPDPETVKAFLLADYLPALYGGFQTLPLRAGSEQDREYYREIAEAIQEAVGQVAGDYTVQARFGRRWFVNSLANLRLVERSTASLLPIEEAVVTGAGPSLEMQTARIAELRLRRGAFLIATDTSLPALLGSGLRPDVVISIDCQLHSYHHFLQGVPEGVTVALDLASPPVLGRQAARALFFASPHPFAQYVTARWRRLPRLDTSGGNVTHAAVSLALALGARRIHLAGADFSYPEGKLYCRGTYLYPLFGSAESRLLPAESQFLSFLFANGSVRRERGPDFIRYTTRPLTEYRKRLEELARGAGASIIALPGKGVSLELPPRPARRSAGTGRPLETGAAAMDWRSFLRGYRDRLAGLSAPRPPLGDWIQRLDGESRSLWITLFPAAAALRGGVSSEAPEGPLILESARQWSLEAVSRALDR